LPVLTTSEYITSSSLIIDQLSMRQCVAYEYKMPKWDTRHVNVDISEYIILLASP